VKQVLNAKSGTNSSVNYRPIKKSLGSYMRIKQMEVNVENKNLLKKMLNIMTRPTLTLKTCH